MINELIKKATDTFKGQATATEPQPAASQDAAPKLHQPANYIIGDEVTAVVSSKSCPHPKMLFISVSDHKDLAVTYVQTKEDWRTNDRIKVRFARVRPDGVLEFAGPPGAHRNKFGRRS